MPADQRTERVGTDVAALGREYEKQQVVPWIKLSTGQHAVKIALPEFEKDEPNDKLIGQLLSDHHHVLRDVLQVSTPKIEKMMDEALYAGALGGKINGSGGGGCMFAYAPENPEQVAEAIESAGGKTFIINSAEGTRID